MVSKIGSIAITLLVVACGAEPECNSTSDCIGGETCVNGECIGPPCTTDSDCPPSQFCSPSSVCQRRDAGGGLDAGRDAGGTDSGREDGGLTDSGGTDARPAPVDAGTDAGTDAGPPCECSGSTSQARNCGTCGRETRTCDGCVFGSYGACVGTDSRCGGDSPFCRNDFCPGWHLFHEVGIGPSQCIDMAMDYLPGTGLGTLDIQVFGRPSASWVKENAAVSCGDGFAPAESGVLSSAGRDTSAPFRYGTSDCTLTTLGRHDSRVRITDTAGRGSFTLPNIVTTNFYNTTCASDRNSCAAVASYCP